MQGVAFHIPLKTDRASSSDCSSKPFGLAVAPLRSAPHRTALRRLAPTRRENTTTVQGSSRVLAPPWVGSRSPDELMVGIRSPDGLVVGSCTSHPGVCVFITAVPITKLFARGGGGVESGGHVLRETTSRGQCELVCPSRTWSSGFDSQTRGTREKRAPPCVEVPISSRVPPHANSFVIGTAVINTHTAVTPGPAEILVWAV